MLGRDAVYEDTEGHPMLAGSPSDDDASGPAPPPVNPDRTHMGGAGRTITAREPLDVGTAVGTGTRGSAAASAAPNARASTRFGIHILEEDGAAPEPSQTSLGGGPGTMVGVPGSELDELLDVPDEPERLDDAWLDDVSDYLRAAELGDRDAGNEPTAVIAPGTKYSGESPTVEVDLDISLFHESSLPLRPGAATGPHDPVAPSSNDESGMVGGRRPMLSGDQPTVQLSDHDPLGLVDDPLGPADDTAGPRIPAPESTSIGVGASEPGFEPTLEHDAPDALDDVFMQFADDAAPQDDELEPLDLDFDNVDEASLNEDPPLAGIMRRRPRRRARPAATPRVGDAPRTGSRLALGESSAREVLQSIEGGRRPVKPAPQRVHDPSPPQVTLDSSPLALSAYDRPPESTPEGDIYGETVLPDDRIAYASTGSLPPIPDRIERPSLDDVDDNDAHADTFDDRKPAAAPSPKEPPTKGRSTRRNRQPALAAVQYVEQEEPHDESAPMTDDGWYAADAESGPASDGFGGAPDAFGGSTVDMAQGADALRDYLPDEPGAADDLFGGPAPVPPPTHDDFDDAPSTAVAATKNSRAPSRILVVTLAVLVLVAITLGGIIVLRLFVL